MTTESKKKKALEYYYTHKETILKKHQDPEFKEKMREYNRQYYINNGSYAHAQRPKRIRKKPEEPAPKPVDPEKPIIKNMGETIVYLN
jgi:hypothetical protein